MQWMSPAQYWKEKTPLWLRVFVYAGGCVCLIMGFSTLVSLGFLGAIDAILMLGLGYGIIAKRSRACAVAASAYYALNQLLVRLLPFPVAETAFASVMVYVMIGLLLMSVYGTFTFRTQYDEYLRQQNLGSEENPRRCRECCDCAAGSLHTWRRICEIYTRLGTWPRRVDC